ncbi:MAG: hypothetical protein ACRENE_27100 [Polyangiaceae bacterium]
MRSSEASRRLAVAVALAAACALPRSSPAQTKPAAGFAVDRFYPSAPGGGWLVMDDLDLRGPLGGAAGLTTVYGMKPLRVPGPSGDLAVVSNEVYSDFAFAIAYDRWRLYLDLDMPFVLRGDTGTASGYSFAAPAVDLGSNPDTLTDARLGFDGRLVGEPGDAFRLGAGAQVFSPQGRNEDYDTDGTVRAMFRVLAAGDVGPLKYAAQLGVHVRPLDDSPVPGSPRGSELLFGAAAGPRFRLDDTARTWLTVGAEVFGQTAFRSPFDSDATGIEALLSARVEATRQDGSLVRLRLGVGPGIDPHFGSAEWRVVAGIEISERVKPRAP